MGINDEADRGSKADIQLAVLLGQMQESIRRIELTVGGLATQGQHHGSALANVTNIALELKKWKDELQSAPHRQRQPSLTTEVMTRTSESIQAVADETAAQTPMIRRAAKTPRLATAGATLGAFAAYFAASWLHSCQPATVNAQQQTPPAITAPAAK